MAMLFATGRGLAIGAMLVAILLSPSPASTATSARAELEDFFVRAIAIRTGATNAKQAREDVRGLARTRFDGRTASRQAMGGEWDRRTGAERDEFARAFTDVLERAYLDIIEGRLPRDRSPAIRIVGEDRLGERVAVVRTRVQTKDGSDAQLYYRMTRPGQTWLIRDVVIDGVSLVDNYRAQFARVLRRSSYAELLTRLRTVAGTGTGTEKTTAALPRSAPSVFALAPFHLSVQTP
jgi:phospholipid transport system substrate-binding protein